MLGIGATVGPADAILTPAGSGDDSHMVESGLQYRSGVQLALAENLDGVMELLDLEGPIVTHSRPLRQTRERRFISHPSPKSTLGLGNRHPVATVSQGKRTFQARPPCTDHEHR